MTEFFGSLNLLMLFLIIGGAGLLSLLASLVVGDIFEALGLDFGIGDGGEFGVFDSRVIGVFLTAFGGFGAIGVQSGWGALTSSLLGLIGGVIFGGIVSLFGRFLYSQQATSSVSAENLIGRTAQVTVPILPGQLGQISCRIGDERVEKLARTKDGTEIKAGSIVRIEEIAGDSVLVAIDSDYSR